MQPPRHNQRQRPPEQRPQFISDHDAEEHLIFLAESDDIAAAAGAELSLADAMVGVVEAREILKSERSSADLRKAEARASNAFVEAVQAAARAKGLFDRVSNKRSTARELLRIFQTLSANKRPAGFV